MFKGPEVINVNSRRFARNSSAQNDGMANLEKKGLGETHVNFKNTNWLVIPQIYWGVPLSRVHSESCEIVRNNGEDFLVVLQDIKMRSPKGGNLPKSITGWVEASFS